MCYFSPVYILEKGSSLERKKSTCCLLKFALQRQRKYKALPIEAAKSNIYETYTQTKIERHSS